MCSSTAGSPSITIPAAIGTATRLTGTESRLTVWNTYSCTGSTPSCALSDTAIEPRRNAGRRRRLSAPSTRPHSSRMPVTAPTDIRKPARSTSVGRSASAARIATASAVGPSGLRPSLRAARPMPSITSARNTENALSAASA